MSEFAQDLPDRLDTQIAAGEIGLSDGHCQRVGRPGPAGRLPRVLLLDAPTVGLDAHAEQLSCSPSPGSRRAAPSITATHQPALTALATCSIHLHPCGILDEPPPRPYQVAGTAR